MDRQPPRTTSDEIDLYIQTYTSLLRSSGEVRVRAFEEAHVYSNSSLHSGAREPVPDLSAFGYASARLPACMPRVKRVVLGQSHEQFEAAGLEVGGWERVRTRGRRRPQRFDGKETLAVYVTSTSDIDDLVPILTAYQVEWNKLRTLLATSASGRQIVEAPEHAPFSPEDDVLARETQLPVADVEKLRSALAPDWAGALRAIATSECDLSIRLLNGSYSQYQRASQRWWSGIEEIYVREAAPRRRPVYFVSSNSHSCANLLGGYARLHRDEMIAFARRSNPEGLAPLLDKAIADRREDEVLNIGYYLLRAFIHDQEERRESVQRVDAESGIRSVESPGHVDVSAQCIELAKLRPDRLDPRLAMPGLEALAKSDAMIINIDYPLGMAAYHHLARLAQGVGEVRGVYVMGKAATLNGRVGDVMVSNVVYDEHSKNTYLLRNAFASGDVKPYLRHGTVLDNQKALTVRSAFLQNRDYMGVFYREGYTVLEMEAGPYLAAIWEVTNSQRYPRDEIVHLSNQVPFDVGILHYASDTPYSRRQDLLSKSLSFFGVDSTYACAIAILRRILENEIERVKG